MTPSRRKFLERLGGLRFIIAGMLATMVGGAFAQSPAEARHPHTRPDAPDIVVILLDDVGFGATSTFGGPAQTPNLDRLAAQGLRYNRFHVMPACSPTRAALLSGRNAHRV